jgi:glutathione synthase/RimK-type ligase-like ATP-grasp enzyme
LLRVREPPALVFNEISDPDSHSQALDRCEKLCRKIGAPVINPPKQIRKTHRDLVAEKLRGIDNVIAPRTTRCRPHAPDGILETIRTSDYQLPVLVRPAGDHGGKRLIRMDDQSDASLLHVFPFDGREYYITEFHDYIDSNGFYNKQRIAIIVHGNAREFMDRNPDLGTVSELTDRFEREQIPAIKELLKEIARRIGLDYFGMDVHLDQEGRLLVFEANANMNILFNRDPQLAPRINRIRDRICSMMSNRSGQEVRHRPREPE